MSYPSKDEAVRSVQLKVQEVCVKKSDTAIVATSGSTAIIQLGETISEVRAAIHCDDSVPGAVLIAQSAIAIGTPSGGVASSQVTLTLGAALAAGDAIILKYVIAD